MKIEPAVREKLEEILDEGLESPEPKIAKLAAEVKLSRRLNNFREIDESLEIDTSYITCAEYQFFLDEQLKFQPYVQPGSAKRPITGISWENAVEFCNWLSSTNSDGVSYYRLPTAIEAQDNPAQQYPQLDCWKLEGTKQQQNSIRVVRAKIPPEYITLPNYLLFGFDVVTVNAQGKEIQRQNRYAQYFTEDLGRNITLDMVAIPGGTFIMGAPKNELDSGHSESPQHKVSIQPFFMGKYPVTQAQWKAVAALPKVNRDLQLNPSYFKGDNRPVEKVTWYNAVEFCARLSRETGREYCLPSEAEW